MKVLVGVDGSEYSNAALRFIGEVVWPKTCQFIVLSTSPIRRGPGEILSEDSSIEMLKKEEERQRQITDRAAIRLREKSLSAEARIAHGDAQTVLVDTARSENADLVVVGSRGASGFGKLFLGSIASHVVMHAPCSVLVVKQPQLHEHAFHESDHLELVGGAS
jgi:nucleotide-binding universal stress UspA family protein